MGKSQDLLLIFPIGTFFLTSLFLIYFFIDAQTPIDILHE